MWQNNYENVLNWVKQVVKSFLIFNLDSCISQWRHLDSNWNNILFNGWVVPFSKWNIKWLNCLNTPFAVSQNRHAYQYLDIYGSPPDWFPSSLMIPSSKISFYGFDSVCTDFQHIIRGTVETDNFHCFPKVNGTASHVLRPKWLGEWRMDCRSHYF